MTVLNGRTPRERGLIYLAVVLFAVFAVWQFGLKPVLEGKNQSEQAYASAMRDFDIVKRGLPRMSSSKGGDLQAFDRSAVIQTAGRLQLDIARMQPAGTGGQQIWFENAQSAAVLSFMSEIVSAHAVKISRVQITARDTGFISAQITLVPAT